MPVYEYKCLDCSKIFDILEKIGGDGSKKICPFCGAKRAKKLFSTFATKSSNGSIKGAAKSCDTCSASTCDTCT